MRSARTSTSFLLSFWERNIFIRWGGWGAGVLVLLFYFLPYLILGDDSIIQHRDQLDSVVVYFKTLSESGHVFEFSNSATIEQWMNGIPRNVFPGAFNVVTWLFVLLSPFAAYMTNFALMHLVGIAGMYVLLTRWVLTDPHEKTYAIAIALAFGLLPLRSVHMGIGVTGLPFLAHAFLNLYNGTDSYLDYFIFAGYAFYSVLAYTGIFVLPFMAGIIAVQLLRKKVDGKAAGRLAGALLLMGGCYVIAEFNLINLYFSDYVSHRKEFSYVGRGSGKDIGGAMKWAWAQFSSGRWEVRTLSWPIIIPTVFAAFIVSVVQGKRSKGKYLAGLLTVLISISILFGLWYWTPFATFREEIGGFVHEVQLHRWYWLSPFLWALAFGIAIAVIRRSGFRFSRFVAIVLVCMQLMYVVRSDGQLRSNYVQLLGKDIRQPTYTEFYSPALFEEVAAYIGKPKSSYRVASVGLYPAVAVYNGFYALDGYQRLYSLEYKHDFREVIAPELDQSPELRKNFDYWGSRAYLFSSELGSNYYFTKKDDRTIHINIRTNKLENMGGEYIFSGVRIENAQEIGLELLKTFTNDTSPYEIRLYAIR